MTDKIKELTSKIVKNIKYNSDKLWVLRGGFPYDNEDMWYEAESIADNIWGDVIEISRELNVKTFDSDIAYISNELRCAGKDIPELFSGISYICSIEYDQFDSIDYAIHEKESGIYESVLSTDRFGHITENRILHSALYKRLMVKYSQKCTSMGAFDDIFEYIFNCASDSYIKKRFGRNDRIWLPRSLDYGDNASWIYNGRGDDIDNCLYELYIRRVYDKSGEDGLRNFFRCYWLAKLEAVYDEYYNYIDESLSKKLCSLRLANLAGYCGSLLQLASNIK